MKPSISLMPRSVYWPLRHMSHSPTAQLGQGTGSGRRTIPTTRSPFLSELLGPGSMTRPRDSWPSTRRVLPRTAGRQSGTGRTIGRPGWWGVYLATGGASALSHSAAPTRSWPRIAATSGGLVQCGEGPGRSRRRILEFVRSRPPMVRLNAACDSNSWVDASCRHRFADRRLLSCRGKGQKSCDRRVASRWPHGLFAIMATWH